MAGLLVARLIWGLAGARASRLSTILGDAIRAPSYARRLFRREPSLWNGHNPMGSLWLLAFWTALAVQIGSGLLSYSDSFFQGGPLHEYVSEAVNARANAIHALCSKILLALVALHLSAVLFYALWKRENLVRPMLTGWKPVRRDADGA